LRIRKEKKKRTEGGPTEKKVLKSFRTGRQVKEHRGKKLKNLGGVFSCTSTLNKERCRSSKRTSALGHPVEGEIVLGREGGN